MVRESQEIVQALKVIAEGEQSYREKKTIKAFSVKEALKIYARGLH
jgi:hypothetical protein